MMNLTADHVRFWQAKQKMPSWTNSVSPITRKPITPHIPNIHSLINGQIKGYTTDRDRHVSNTLVVVRLRLKRMPIDEALFLGDCSVDPRRRHDCVKWLKIIRERRRQKGSSLPN